MLTSGDSVLGRQEGPLSARLYKGIWGDTETVSPADIWDDAITDIAIVRPGTVILCVEQWVVY